MLQTKISMPRIGENIVRREGIEEKLMGLPHYKFAFISAPAGYVKTTAVVDYITREKVKCAWLSIDTDDNEPIRFWRYIMASISRCTGRDNFTQLSIDASLISSNILIDLLISAIETVNEEFIIVLDDYHLIHNNTILNSVAYFIQYIPVNTCLIIMSRVNPDRELSLLCARGFALRLDINDLAFSNANTADFFVRKGFHLSESEIQDIERYTEGWPAGLVAASFYIQENAVNLRALDMFSGQDKNISLILEHEVFNNWSDEIKDFLIRTSFLDRLSGSLCNVVTQTVNSAEILKNLSQHNSFVIALDADHEWYRYHHLLQDFLSGLFQVLDSEEKRRLYHLTGKWYLQQEQYTEAIKWLLKAEEYEQAWPVIYRTAFDCILSHEYLVLRNYIERLPEKTYENYPNIFSACSWVSFMNGENDLAGLWIKKAWKSFNQTKSTLSASERNHMEICILFGELNVDIQKLDLARITFDLKRLAKLKPDVPVHMGALNWNEYNLLNTPYGFCGRLNYIDQYLPYLDIMYDYMGETAHYINIIVAECFYEQNKLEKLSQILIRYIGALTENKDPGIMVPAFIVLAKWKLSKGDIAGAFSVIEEVQALLNEKVGNVWGYHLNVFRAKFWLINDDIEQTSEFFGRKKIGIFDEISCTRETEYITYARFLMRTDNVDKALALLNRLNGFALKKDRLRARMEILCLLAICNNKKGDLQSAMSFLEQALSLGISDNYVRTFVDEREAMTVLLDKYIRANRSGGQVKYLTYAKNLFRQTNEYIHILSTAMQGCAKSKKGYTDSLLNEKEMEILRLMAQNKSNDAIVKELFLSLNTVKQYNSRIYSKLGVKNRYDAVVKARSLGIVE